MNRFSAISFAVLTLAGTLTSDAFADGNYSESCTTTALLVGSDLQADCKRRDGSIRRSTIRLNDYIANDDGRLHWRRDGGFKASCGNVRLKGGIPLEGAPILTAGCMTRGGLITHPTIDLDEGIANVDGKLVYVGPE